MCFDNKDSNFQSFLNQLNEMKSKELRRKKISIKN